jgi:glycosyltransferase involved in cell wall biosynthesis
MSDRDARPYISVATPVWNAAATVRRTLEAAQRQKASFDHVVYDGGSSDNTRDIVSEFIGRYPVRLMQGENLGVYGNVANAHRTTTGEIMGWINGDDFYLPYTLSMVERIFRTRPDVHWIIGIPSWLWEGQDVWSVHGLAPIFSRALIRRGWHRANRLGCLQQESMFWRRSLFEKVEGDKVLRAFKYAADFQLWRAFAENTELHTVRSVLACFTRRPGQFSQVKRREYDLDCGIREGAMNLWPLGKLFLRIYSNLFYNRAIYPESLVSSAPAVAAGG